MKKLRIFSLLLVLALAFTFVSCGSENPSETSKSEQSSAAASSEAESSEPFSSLEASNDVTEDTSVDTSSATSDESAVSSSEESSEESVELSSEASSEESSEAPSEASSEDVSYDGDVSVLNPYYGTDIKPAEGKVIAFTFDDGPSYTSSTSKILDKLEELGMKATFFVVGNRVSEKTAPLIKRMNELGCDIGNHSYDHPNFNKMTVSQVKKQIDDTNARLQRFANLKGTLIRPPYGNITNEQMEALYTPIICWDIDSLDWDLRNAQKIYDRTIERVHSGGIVLMHDIYDTTAEAFCMLADKLVAEGYTLVTISELLGTEKLMCTTIKYGFKW